MHYTEVSSKPEVPLRNRSSQSKRSSEWVREVSLNLLKNALRFILYVLESRALHQRLESSLVIQHEDSSALHQRFEDSVSIQNDTYNMIQGMTEELHDMTVAQWQRRDCKRFDDIFVGLLQSDVDLTSDLAKAQEDMIHQILKWLQSGLRSSTGVPIREEGTCEWIFDHPAYRTWAVGDHPRPLWINGIPGFSAPPFMLIGV